MPDETWVNDNIDEMDEWLEEQGRHEKGAGLEQYLMGWETAMRAVLRKHKELWTDPTLLEAEKEENPELWGPEESPPTHDPSEKSTLKDWLNDEINKLSGESRMPLSDHDYGLRKGMLNAFNQMLERLGEKQDFNHECYWKDRYDQLQEVIEKEFGGCDDCIETLDTIKERMGAETGPGPNWVARYKHLESLVDEWVSFDIKEQINRRMRGEVVDEDDELSTLSIPTKKVIKSLKGKVRSRSKRQPPR